MANLQNTLFNRLLNQKEERDAQLAAAQQAGWAALGKQGQDLYGMTVDQVNRDQSLGAALGKGAAASGELEPQMQDARAQEAAHAAYGVTSGDMSQEQAKLRQARALQQAQMGQQRELSYAQMAATAQRSAADRDAQNTRALAQRILDEAKMKQDALFKNADLKLKGRDLGLKARELDIKEKQNPNLKLSAAAMEDVGMGMDVLGKLKALRAIPDKDRFLGTFSGLEVGWEKGIKRLGGNADAAYLKDAQNFNGGTADITSAIAKATYGATRAGEEIKEAAASLLNTKMSGPEFDAALDRIQAAQTRYILARTTASQGGYPLTQGELDRKIDEIYYQGQKAVKGPGTPNLPGQADPNQAKSVYKKYRDQGLDHVSAAKKAAAELGLSYE